MSVCRNRRAPEVIGCKSRRGASKAVGNLSAVSGSGPERYAGLCGVDTGTLARTERSRATEVARDSILAVKHSTR